MSKIRILVADDHTLFREGLVSLFTSIDDTKVIGQAASGTEVIELADQLKPDVILMDIQMPSINGIEATRRILDADPSIAIIVLTMYDDDDSIFAAMRAGARGYVLKGADQDEMLRTIRAVYRGEALFGPAVAQKLVAFFTGPGAEDPPEVFPELTAREREVLELIAQGKSNQDIARQLSLSPKTIRNHASNIFNKLQVVDRAQAIIRARDAGMGITRREKRL